MLDWSRAVIYRYRQTQKEKTLAFEKKENRLSKFFIFDLKPDLKQSFPLCSELSQPCARSLTREVSCKIKSSPPLFDTLCNMLRLASFVSTWYALIREKHSVSQLSSIVAKSVNFWQKLWKRSWFIRRMWRDSKSLEKNRTISADTRRLVAPSVISLSS